MSEFGINRACPSCGHWGAELIALLPAKSFCGGNSTYRTDWASILGIAGHAAFPLARCAQCRFVFAGWLPPDDFLRKVYESVIDEERGRLESHAPGWVARQYWILSVLLKEVSQRWAFDERQVSALDFGCSYGTQLLAIRQAGIRVVGVDASERARRHVSALGIAVAPSVEAAREHAPFDIVILNEVLEHLADFRATLRDVRGLMADGGIAWISVPDFSAWRLEEAVTAVLQGRIATRELNPWEHLNYFTPSGLRRSLVEVGLRPVPIPHSMSLGPAEVSGWKQPREQFRVARALFRWLLRGPALRTELLVERD